MFRALLQAKAAHTLGHWRVEVENLPTEREAGERHVQIWSEAGDFVGAVQLQDGPLVAAAPELLVACEDALGAVRCNCNSAGCQGTCTHGLLLAAIAKARSKA